MELNCPTCDKTLVNSWEIWEMLGDIVECCGKKYEVEFDESWDEEGDNYHWFWLKEIKD